MYNYLVWQGECLFNVLFGRGVRLDQQLLFSVMLEDRMISGIVHFLFVCTFTLCKGLYVYGL
jgi:hypothetical protein